jgi:outer membrane protein assembly factor BamB
MRLFFLILFFSTISSLVLAKNNLDETRQHIGSTFSAPILYKTKLYFVATTGVLYESDLSMSQVVKLYEGKKQTMGTLTLDADVLYWGEGLHDDKKVTLHAFDLKTKKIKKEIEVDGHIERAILIDGNTLYIGQGEGGIAAYTKDKLEKIWQTNLFNKKSIHADGNIVKHGSNICTTSVYGYKGILCLEQKTGKIVQSFDLTQNPKSEIIVSNDILVGLATEADLVKSNWTIPADFYAIDLKNNKIKFVQKLRGFNFFAPTITSNKAFVTLSTGDFININLNDGKIEFLGEFPEPFINNSFMKNEEYCSIGIMGKFLCFSKAKIGYGISTDKRFMESPIGKISEVNKKWIAPSRVGYFLLN